MSESIYPIFSVYGIEVEYMLVDAKTLDVKPIADKVITALAGELKNEVEMGKIAISNELVLHVIEFKTNGPSASLDKLDKDFYEQIQRVNTICKNYDCCLLPTGAHPWMNPHKEMVLWPHGDRIIYANYHRIFNCEGHGWSNLQSTHINLPFANDIEFVALHRAIRYLLPIIPALTASSPVIDAKQSLFKDTRLSFYGGNQKKIPSISGQIVPEDVNSIDDYKQTILVPMYQAIAPDDPEGVLQHEWLNSRGAIARFERHAIEIRVLDTQECVTADIACAALIIAVLKKLAQQALPLIATDALRTIYDASIRHGMTAEIFEVEYLQAFSPGFTLPTTVAEVWKTLFAQVESELAAEYQAALRVILEHGNLAERMLAFLQDDFSQQKLHELFALLATSLKDNQQFLCKVTA